MRTRHSTILGIALVCASSFAHGEPLACDVDLIPVERVEPRFPREALVKGIGGSVVIEGTVGKDGRVLEAHVVSSEPAGLYDEASLTAIRRWRFEPCVVDGQAVERPFTQRLDYNLSGSGPVFSEKLVRAVKSDLSEANRYFDQLRGLCPDRYPRAGDAPNEALRRRATKAMHIAKTLPDNPMSTIYSITEAGGCLFSSWEQLGDAEAWAIAARYAEYEPRDKREADDLRGSIAALRRTRFPAEPGAVAAAPAEQLHARAWVFARLAPAYHELTQAQALSLPAAPALGAATKSAIDEYVAAMAKPNPAHARKIVLKALEQEQPPNDRAQLLLALARVLVVRSQHDEARRALEEVLSLQGLPWNVTMAARTALVQVCGELEDLACFDSSLVELNRQLGTEDRLSF